MTSRVHSSVCMWAWSEVSTCGARGGGGEAPGAESSQWLEEDTQLQLLENVCNIWKVKL